MTEAFNADYYVAMATIVPILMLAITWGSFVGLRLDALVRRMLKGKRVRRWLAVVLSLAIVAPFAGAVWTEFEVLCAIRDRVAMGQTGIEWAQAITLVLLIIAAIGCAVSVVAGLFDQATA